MALFVLLAFVLLATGESLTTQNVPLYSSVCAAGDLSMTAANAQTCPGTPAQNAGTGGHGESPNSEFHAWHMICYMDGWARGMDSERSGRG